MSRRRVGALALAGTGDGNEVEQRAQETECVGRGTRIRRHAGEPVERCELDALEHLRRKCRDVRPEGGEQATLLCKRLRLSDREPQ